MSPHTETDGHLLSGHVALVSGASRGIGLAIAIGFAECGAKVLITGRKEESLRAALESAGDVHADSLHAVAAHSARPEEVARAFEEAERRFGPVRTAVNCAATNPSMEPLSRIDLAAFDKTMETNVRGYLIVAREAAGRMQRAGSGGSIINVSSVAAYRAVPGLGAYGVSKAAVNALTIELAAELGKDGIRVNGIAPGVVRTRFSEALWKDPAREARAAAGVPLGRIAEPADITGAAVFLASDASRYITGQTLIIDGGMMAV
jgi:NAD(P)-dependent dehydrogenase (short-subunit alcohol dehydrogenase family)